MSQNTLALIGLGSNLDNPKKQIQSAIQSLKKIRFTSDIQCAPWYSSKPIGPQNQPDYINTVASLNTSLAPLELLYELQSIENQQGRQRKVRWGARTLDLDLLLFGDVSLNHTELTLPHPEIVNRSFVLLPLYDLKPDLVFPDGRMLSALVKQCDNTGLVKIDGH